MGKDRIQDALEQHRAKLHVFEPSKREIWTIVGKEKEYWIDPDNDFCSCTGYYFGRVRNKKKCYHLDAVRTAQETGQIETVQFSDEEYDDFISGILGDLWLDTN